MNPSENEKGKPNGNMTEDNARKEEANNFTPGSTSRFPKRMSSMMPKRLILAETRASSQQPAMTESEPDLRSTSSHIRKPSSSSEEEVDELFAKKKSWSSLKERYSARRDAVPLTRVKTADPGSRPLSALLNPDGTNPPDSLEVLEHMLDEEINRIPPTKPGELTRHSNPPELHHTTSESSLNNKAFDLSRHHSPPSRNEYSPENPWIRFRPANKLEENKNILLGSINRNRHLSRPVSGESSNSPHDSSELKLSSSVPSPHTTIDEADVGSEVEHPVPGEGITTSGECPLPNPGAGVTTDSEAENTEKTEAPPEQASYSNESSMDDFAFLVGDINNDMLKGKKTINLKERPDIAQLILGVKNNVRPKLNLSKKGLGDQAVYLVARYLNENTSLTELDLGFNDIREEGMSLLAEVLAKNSVLRSLSLEGNEYGGKGNDRIAVALAKNTTLTYLDVRNTYIWREHWEKHLQTNVTIVNLLSENAAQIISDDLISKMIKTNSILKETSDLSKSEWTEHIASKYPNLFNDSVKYKHVAAVHEMVKRGWDLTKENPLLKCIEQSDFLMSKVLLSYGCPIPQLNRESYKEGKERDMIFELIKKAEKDHYIDLSSGAVRWLVDWLLPKDTLSICLADNQLTDFTSLVASLVPLPKLSVLDISKNQLTSIPTELKNLTQLTALHMSDNKIDSLPEFLLQSKIRQLEFKGNPLANLPEEIQKKGALKIVSFLKEMQAPSKNWNRLKLVVVGQENVGKTHLINVLRKKDYPKNISTDGIEVDTLAFGKSKKYKFLVYDFGGQEVFYPTHQFYLSIRALYIVVFNLAEPEKLRTEYWLRKLRTLATAPPCILVGTHLDDPKCKQENYLKNISSQVKKWQQQFNNIQGHIFLSCLTQENVKELKNLMQIVAGKQKIVNTLIPQSYLNMDRLLSTEKTKKKILSWEEYKDLASKAYITSKEIDQATQFLHDVGSLIWFNEGNLKNLVILDDKWLADIMSSIVSFKSNWKDGILLHSSLPIVWRNFPTTLHRTLLDILQNFEVVFPQRGHDDSSIVPSLLPLDPDPFFTKFNEGYDLQYYSCFERIYKMEFMPIGFFPRIIARLFQVPEVYCHHAFRSGFLMTPNSIFHQATHTQPKELLEDALKHGYQQGSVHYITTPEETLLKFKIWKPRNNARGGDNQLLMHAVMATDQLITDSYKRYDQSIQRIAAVYIGPPLKRYEFTYQELVSKLQSGNPFLEVSSTRRLSISQLAPDISFDSVPIKSNEDIEILEVLGRGGCGVVYKGKMIKEDKLVAVKELRMEPEENGQVSDLKFREFQHEVFMMSGLRCKYLVELYCVQTNPLRMVLEFVPGKDLGDVLHSQQGKKLSWHLKSKLALDISYAMAYLQTQVVPPIIHRDLRSPNVFVLSLDENHQGAHCKVADFGLAQRVYTLHSESLFNWQYLAPEVIDEYAGYDERADLFSYGIVLWEIVTQQFPYDEFGTKKVMQLRPEEVEDPNFLAHLKEDGWLIDKEKMEAYIIDLNRHTMTQLIIDEELRPTIPTGIPDYLADIIRDCWNKNPAERPKFPEICKTIRTSLEHSSIYLPPEPWLDSELGLKTIEAKGRFFVSDNTKRARQRTILHNFLDRYPSPVTTLSLVRDNIWVCCLDGKINIYDYKSGKMLEEIAAYKSGVYVTCMTVSEPHAWIGTTDSMISLWSITKRKIKRQLKGHAKKLSCLLPYPMNSPSPVVNAVPTTPDEKLKKKKASLDVMWSGDSEGKIILWKGEAKWKRQFLKGEIFGMCIIPSGMAVLSTGLLSIFDAESKLVKEINLFSQDYAGLTLANKQLWLASKNGLYVVDCFDNWNILKLPTEFNSTFHSIVTVSADKENEIQVWAGGEDAIYVYSVQKKSIIERLDEHEDIVTSFVAIDAENQVWSGSNDRAIVRWHY